jgi:hypothetical protein
VLSGALAVHFPASISAMYENEHLAADQAQALARRALGESAYDVAAGRGAAMDEDEIVRYAVSEFRQVAELSAQPAARAPDAPPPDPASGPQATLPAAGPPRSA